MASLGERSARRLAPDFPHAIRLDHPPTADPRPRYGFGRPAHPELERLLASLTGRYRAALESFAPFHHDRPELAEVNPRGSVFWLETRAVRS